MRLYLEKGGFLWADDFWGEYAWNWLGRPAAEGAASGGISHRRSAARASDVSHAVRGDEGRADSVDQLLFRRRRTSERGADSAVPHARAISDKSGRMIVLMTHNTDFGDSWEREGDDATYFLNFGPDGYAFGINAVLYALTH